MNLLRVIATLTGLLLLIQTETVLTPIEARKKVGETVTVEMTIQVTKDRLEKKGEIYMDSEIDFQSDKNFAAVITRLGAAKLKEVGIDDPAEHFKGKMVRVTGLVKEVEKVPRIEVDDAKQIRIVEGK
jgi:DNA/RNA endonuclease YhcR with UshA esterase domain